MRKGVALAAVFVVAAAAVVTAVGIGFYRSVKPIFTPDECTATVEGHTVRLSVEQAQNAALIVALSVERGLPARAATIALATAYQESKIVNIEYGDRDSLGLFQQRPSQGWGSPEQVLDPVYATHAFYDGLEKVEGYRDMPVTEAAQSVQRSAFPEAYADHEADARVLASALTGNSPGAFSCRISSSDPGDLELTENGLTAAAETVRAEITGVFGDLPTGGFAPGGVTDGHMPGSAHYQGRAIDIFFRPINEATGKHGWALAQYLVAQADRLGIETVIFDGRIWTARRSGSGWRDYKVDTSGRSPETAAILRHHDHVHVDVAD